MKNIDKNTVIIGISSYQPDHLRRIDTQLQQHISKNINQSNCKLILASDFNYDILKYFEFGMSYQEIVVCPERKIVLHNSKHFWRNIFGDMLNMGVGLAGITYIMVINNILQGEA